MSSLDRMLFLFFTIIVALTAGYVFYAASGLIQPLDLLFVGALNQYRLEIAIISLLALVMALHFALLAVRPKSTGQNVGFAQVADLGEVKISLDALEQITLQAAGSQRAVKQVKAQLSLLPSGLAIRLRVTATSQQNLVELAKGLQQVVKEQVEAATSIAVNEVNVVFVEVAASVPRLS